jgi:membrane associated rhomboid family serine protease
MFIIGRHIGANVTAIAVLLGLNLVITFLPGSNISWQAHIGGGLVGVLVGFIYARTRAIRQQRTQKLLLAAVGVGLLALLTIPVVVYG